CLIYFFIEMGEYAIGFWMPSIIKSSGFDSLSLIGVLSSIPYLFAGIVMIYVGRSADLHKERRWHLVIPMLVGMAGLLIAAKFAHSPVIAMIGLTLSTIGVLTSLPMFWTVPSAMLGSAAAAGGLALINSIGNLAGFCSPYLVGWIKDTTNNTDIALYILAGSVFIGALLILRIPKKLLAH
ncbi:MFS transporter, partial [Salmonella enterica subsp. enterica serovar Florida]|nr:MFS transporter [Salmonella enterica subsp. enterica serovar Florida]